MKVELPFEITAPLNAKVLSINTANNSVVIQVEDKPIVASLTYNVDDVALPDSLIEGAKIVIVPDGMVSVVGTPANPSTSSGCSSRDSVITS